MKKNKKIPQGLQWIKAILLLNIISGILTLILKKTLISGIIFFRGVFGDILIVISLVIAILIWFGINKRIYTLYKLALIWFGITLLFGIISSLTNLFKLELISQIIRPILWILIYSLFIWYLIKRKDYFLKKTINLEDLIVQKQEKFFKRIFIGIFILYIIFGTNTFEAYKTITVMKNIRDKEVPVALDLCKAKSQSNKDFCIYKIVESRKNEYDFGNGEICEEIFSDIYKDRCYLSLKQCNKISDEYIKRICS